LEERTPIEIKGKGEMITYLLVGRKSESWISPIPHLKLKNYTTYSVFICNKHYLYY
jgi:hypothetical protein